MHIWRRSYDIPPPGREPEEHRRARAALLRLGHPARRARRQERHRLGPRQLAPGPDHAPRRAQPRRGDAAGDRHGLAPGLPPERRRHGCVEAGPGGLGSCRLAERPHPRHSRESGQLCFMPKLFGL